MVKIPEKAPDWQNIVKKDFKKIFKFSENPIIKSLIEKTDQFYYYWDKVRSQPLPEEFDKKEVWAFLRLRRMMSSSPSPVQDINGRSFTFWLTDDMQQKLHLIDQSMAGNIALWDLGIDKKAPAKYMISSLMEEAITSSQIEGAVATIKDAKKMLLEKRKPKNKSEQMIYNNFITMQSLKNNCKKDLSIELLLELHALIAKNTLYLPRSKTLNFGGVKTPRIDDCKRPSIKSIQGRLQSSIIGSFDASQNSKFLTEGGMDTEEEEGKFRTSKDDVSVVTNYGETLFTPPNAEEIPSRLEALIQFANDQTEKPFIHPVIKAIILHFWMAYIHPFTDGNGRIARTLFYWYMLRHGYVLFEYITISKIILKRTAKYANAYLYSEHDDNDLTYFIHFHLEIIMDALKELKKHIESEREMSRRSLQEVAAYSDLNLRQTRIIQHVMNHPHDVLTIKIHQNNNGVAYQTARTDLMELEKKGWLKSIEKGKTFYFIPTEKLEK